MVDKERDSLQSRLDSFQSELRHGEHEDYYDKAKLYRKERIYLGTPYGSEERLEAIEKEIQVRFKITQHEIFTIGELLYEAKEIARGRFKRWIEETFDFSYETANNFMNVYMCCFGYQHVVEHVKPSILYKLSSKSFSRELREYLFSECDLERLTNKDLKQISEKFKEGGFEAVKGDFERIAKKKRVYDQVAYSLDLLEQSIRQLEKLKEKLEKHGLPGLLVLPIEEQTGQEQEADEINSTICRALQKTINDLDRVRIECWDKVERSENKPPEVVTIEA